jgi:hypothetical protein
MSESKKTPEDWGKKHGHWREVNALIPETQAKSHWKAAHATAEYLHGWADHAYHYENDPLLITEADYVAALEAAANYPNTPPHGPALSKTKKG